MNRIIAIVNQKGGVGKTTTAINLGAALARAGRRVLLVDVDPQANLTASLGVRAGDAPTLYRVLRGDASAREAIVPHGGYDVLPAGIDLSGAEIEFAAAAGREFLLSEALSPVLPCAVGATYLGRYARRARSGTGADPKATSRGA